MSLILTPLPQIPFIIPGDDLGAILIAGLEHAKIELQNNDILVITQKIVSKAEGRLVRLSDIVPSEKAQALAAQSAKDPRLVELILQESNEVLRVTNGTIIVEHRLGFICASAGIDHSNVHGEKTDSDDTVLLLPFDPDESAVKIRRRLEVHTGKHIGVMIIDSHGRPWRLGIVGSCIGISGMPSIIDKRGDPDLYGYHLQITQIAVADELAAGASLMMGQADEGTPVIHVRGFPYELKDGHLKDLLRPKGQDLFR